MHFCRPLENNFFQNFINHLATLNKTNHFRNMDAWFLVILLDKLFQLLIFILGQPRNLTGSRFLHVENENID